MAGFLIHLATGNLDELGDLENLTSKERAYIIGLYISDIAKLGLIKSKEDYDKLFSGCEEKDIMTYEEYMEFSQDPHYTGNKNLSRNPDLKKFLENHSEDLKKPIWQGIFGHIVGDKVFYNVYPCINTEQIDADLKNEGKTKKEWRESKTAESIYGKDGDYNLINRIIEDKYNVLRFLPPELVEKCNVRFSEAKKEPKYMDIGNIQECIEIVRKLNKDIRKGNNENVLDYFEQHKNGEKGSKDEILQEILQAVKYYEGDTNNSFLPEELFDEETRNASKAYVTINLIMGDDETEKQLFKEGKLQTPGLISPEGIRKMLEIYKGFYKYCLHNPINQNVKLCAMKRCGELDSSFIRLFTSTTKHLPKEIYNQGYGNKVDLALCYYRLHEGALAFDFKEALKEDYAKEQEREVLLMPGNMWKVMYIGPNEKYCGKDLKPAKVYLIDVYGPNFSKILKSESNNVKDMVFDPKRLEMVRNLYKEMNDRIKSSDDFPTIPDEYWEWKHSAQQMVYESLRDIYIKYSDKQHKNRLGDEEVQV